jgi:hypothetical protein
MPKRWSGGFWRAGVLSNECALLGTARSAVYLETAHPNGRYSELASRSTVPTLSHGKGTTHCVSHAVIL